MFLLCCGCFWGLVLFQAGPCGALETDGCMAAYTRFGIRVFLFRVFRHVAVLPCLA